MTKIIEVARSEIQEGASVTVRYKPRKIGGKNLFGAAYLSMGSDTFIDMAGKDLEHMQKNSGDFDYAEKWARKTLASV